MKRKKEGGFGWLSKGKKLPPTGSVKGTLKLIIGQ